MTGEHVVRRLAAILAADIVGYSRLMGRDENGTVTCFKARRTERLEPTLARHGGRLVKLTGDGALVEFPSAVKGFGLWALQWVMNSRGDTLISRRYPVRCTLEDDIGGRLGSELRSTDNGRNVTRTGWTPRFLKVP